MSDTEDEEKKYKRKKKAERKQKRVLNRGLKSIGRKIVIIPNKDKDTGWMEKWKDNPSNIGRIPHSFRLCALGGVGRGKTNTMKNIFLAHQSGNRKFQKLYICCVDVNSKEWLDLEPNGVFDALPDLELFDPKEKTCLIIDDFEFEKCSKATMQRLSTIYRYVSSHKNLSVMTGYQSFFDTPSIIRKCSNVFIIYKPNSKTELNTIANRVGLDQDDIKYIFKKICNGNYDSLMIDNTVGSPARLRKNVYQHIILEDDDED